MKEGIVFLASWRLLKGSMLATLPLLGVEGSRAFYKKVRAIYHREMAAAQEEWEKPQDDRRQEALRGGRALE